MDAVTNMNAFRTTSPELISEEGQQPQILTMRDGEFEDHENSLYEPCRHGGDPRPLGQLLRFS